MQEEIRKLDNIIIGRKAEYQVTNLLGEEENRSYFSANAHGKTYFCKRYDLKRRHHAEPEVRTLRLLNDGGHPSILHLEDTDEQELTLIFKYIHGEQLGDYLLKTPMLDTQDIYHITQAIADALLEVHRRHIVHLDVKPENILLQYGGSNNDTSGNIQESTPLLTDFGCSRNFGYIKGDIFIGTPCCASPEQIKCLYVDQRTDIYALGVTVYELLSGKFPFHGKTIRGLLENILVDSTPKLEDIPKLGIDSSISDVVYKAMQKNKRDRQHTISEFIRDIEQTLM